MKHIKKLILIVLLAVCGCCGCAGTAPVAESVSENQGKDAVSDSDVEETSLTAEVEEVEAEEADAPEFLTKIQLEAGTPEVKAEVLFADYDGQEVIFETSPTEEELRETGGGLSGYGNLSGAAD